MNKKQFILLSLVVVITTISILAYGIETGRITIGEEECVMKGGPQDAFITHFNNQLKRIIIFHGETPGPYFNINYCK